MATLTPNLPAFVVDGVCHMAGLAEDGSLAGADELPLGPVVHP
ncbi:hypothetical protein AB0M05_06450 [Streptomyces violaceusniger]